MQILLCPLEIYDMLPEEVKLKWKADGSVRVCRHPPQNKQDFEAMGKLWPLTFRPTEIDRIRCREKELQEQLDLGTPLNCREIESSFVSRQQRAAFIGVVKEEIKLFEDRYPHHSCRHSFGAVIVNPKNMKV